MQKLLILHGALGSASQMSPLKLILEKHFKVYTLDFTGHGINSKDRDEFSIEQFGQDVIHFLDENKIDTPINIFGYSMGGYVALYLAAKYPKRIKRIYTIATKFNWNKESAKKESGFLNTDNIELKVPKYAQMLSDRHGSEQWKNVCNKTASMMISLGSTPVLTPLLLKEITCTCKICVGSLDRMVSIEESLLITNEINDSIFEVIEHLEHPFEKINYTLLSTDLISFFN